MNNLSIKLYLEVQKWISKVRTLMDLKWVRVMMVIALVAFFSIKVINLFTPVIHAVTNWDDNNDGVLQLSLSAGHGGSNSTAGKRAYDNSFYEWDINDKVCDVIQDELDKYNVEILRVDDTSGLSDPSLRTRLNMAKQFGSELHVDVHQNAYGEAWNNATGVETYYGSIQDKELATKISDYLSQFINTTNRGPKTANLFVTREYTKQGIDNVLVEGLFMSNKADVSYMQTQEYVNKYGKAVAKAIIEQYNLIERSAK